MDEDHRDHRDHERSDPARSTHRLPRESALLIVCSVSWMSITAPWPKELATRNGMGRSIRRSVPGQSLPD